LGVRKDVAVITAKDAVKGERLVLITNHPQLGLKEVRSFLKAEGFSDLAVPNDIRFLKEIPKLGTGKTDYGALQKMLQIT
jgi:acyl-[acyl-carrier-protein]-phospholipid O-acyltransferase / long-chain-fatty-acid--[acyl-carrier-protein] ligase